MRSRTSCSPASTLTLTPVPAGELARRVDDVGRGLRAGRLVDEVARPRDRVRDRGAPFECGAYLRTAATDDEHPLELRRLRVALVAQELVAAEHDCLRRAPARSRAGRQSSGAASSSVVATVLTVFARRASVAPARRNASGVRSSRAPTPTSTTRLRAEVPVRRHRERLAALAREVGLLHELGETAAEGVVDAVARRGRARVRRTRARRAGRRGRDRRRGRASARRSGPMGVARWGVGTACRTVGSCNGRQRAFLPAGERVHEVGEPVQVRHDLAGRVRANRAASRRPRPRSARRTNVRARSSAAATRFSPGHDELLRWLEARGDVVDDRFQPLDHRRGRERDTSGCSLRRCRVRSRARRRRRTIRAATATTACAVRCRVRLSARATPSALTASSTAPYAAGPASSLRDATAVEQTRRAVVAGTRIDLQSFGRSPASESTRRWRRPPGRSRR